MIWTRQRQRGIVVVLVAMGLLALLAMVGLALDTGHLMINKSRLQATVDASALAAAKVVDLTGSEPQADTAARGTFDLNAADHPELSRALSGADITVQFSNSLNPFAPGTAPANYVRVFASHFTMASSGEPMSKLDKPEGVEAAFDFIQFQRCNSYGLDSKENLAE